MTIQLGYPGKRVGYEPNVEVWTTTKLERNAIPTYSEAYDRAS